VELEQLIPHIYVLGLGNFRKGGLVSTAELAVGMIRFGQVPVHLLNAPQVAGQVLLVLGVYLY